MARARRSDRFVRACFAFACFTCAGCASPDVSGAYLVDTTNGHNGCDLPGWVVGGMGHSLEFDITRQGDSVVGTPADPVALELDLLLGAHVLTGALTGTRLTLRLEGVVPRDMGGCAFVYNVTLEGDFDGNQLRGSITYRIDPQGGVCDAIATCTTDETFVAMRR